jgi:arylsulfatase A-like enzyme
MPTLLAAAKVAQPAHLDGTSLLPLLVDGRVLPDRALYWHYPHYANQGGAPGAAIRRGDWKLIEWFEDGKRELFNLALDASETTDVSAGEPNRVAQLTADLHAWQRDVKARFPTPNPAFNASQPDGRRIVGR